MKQKHIIKSFHHQNIINHVISQHSSTQNYSFGAKISQKF